MKSSLIITFIAIFILSLCMLWAVRDEPKEYKPYIVGQGDTLYSICVSNYPNEDWREIAYDIKKQNGIGCNLSVGQVIQIPQNK